MTTLIIARHGNTFDKGDIVTRVGGRTDLPLVEKGREQAKAIGRYLQKNRLIPDVVYSSNLQRTYDTAKIAIQESGVTNPIFQLDIFNEIDYGPDENKPEEEVVARIGKEAIDAWDKDAIVPDGWKVDPEQLIKYWHDFADQIKAHDDNETVLVVTSNGTARFAPYITEKYEDFIKTYTLKLSTGAIGILEFSEGVWQVKAWNIRP
ncbi:MAG: phosphoglycerate mutase [Micavibrio sp. TMED27]|mgnify:FL=1|nr:phosphoglycerate mutase [Micavibrio sp.]OUT91865.1 MAG: phosphoglycerate mutase [Micavibrio sp. TMED27]|tara:strand:- start:217 stop:834 length:618 start_codon:yes stop_codon:yes gene_type:complete